MAWNNIEPNPQDIIEETMKLAESRESKILLKQALDTIDLENNYKVWNEEERELLEEYPFLYQVIQNKKEGTTSPYERKRKKIRQEHINYAKRKMLATAVTICLYERPEQEEQEERKR